jgi:capsular exopolysaccharide synthesis family protein
MGEILEALRRADEERERRDTPRVVHRAPEPSFPTLPARESETVSPAEPAELRPESQARLPQARKAQRGQRVAIPRDRSGPWEARAVLMDDCAGAVAESYRHFAVTVLEHLAARGARSVVVTSAIGGEGKTTTACNLAFASASISGGGRIALVDLDMRHPSVAQALALQPSTGIDSVLAGRTSLDAACLSPDVESLELYLLARGSPRPHEILSGPALGALVRELEQNYDLVIIDTPPSLLVPDASLILKHAAAYVTIVRTGVTRIAALRAMLKQLPREKFLGPFVNEVRTQQIVDYTYYHHAEKDNGER